MGIFDIFKKSEFETLSVKIKQKNYKIVDKLNKEEIKRLSKLDEKNKKKRVREIIEDLSGLDFSYVFSYQFHFEDLPMFSYQLHIKDNNYQLMIYGRDEYFGFQCDYLLNENVFRLTLKKQEEIEEDEDDFKRLVGNKTFDITNKITKNSFEVTKKAKKLHKEMISTMYLNEFGYNESKKNPIRVI